jgi:hypothetical protein
VSSHVFPPSSRIFSSVIPSEVEGSRRARRKWDPSTSLGMTGKFHTTWGEFGGFKHPNALRYECAAMLAYGAKCSVGDQLHPLGRMDESTYVLYLLYGNTIQRGSGELFVIDDLLPLNQVEVSVRVPESIRRVTLEPQGREIPFAVQDGKIALTVERLECHQMVVLHY